MKFLLKDQVPKFDFEFQLLASEDYWKWKGNPIEIVYESDGIFNDMDNDTRKSFLKTCCPVGSLEFCEKHGLASKPWNIPTELKDFAVGHVVESYDELNEKDSNGSFLWHVKSSEKIKHPDNEVYKGDHIKNVFEDKTFQAVRYFDSGFKSEWRLFIYNQKIIDMQNYAGDFWIMPDKAEIYKMLIEFEKFHRAPSAYTLDVGVIDEYREEATKIIEVHDFYSCGTYNFNDHYHLPLMLWTTWQKLKS